MGWSAFLPIVVFRFIQTVWLMGVASSAYQSALNVIPRDRKDQARAFLDGIPGQAGTAIAGIVLLVGESALRPRALFSMGLAAALAGLVVSWKAMRGYGGALVAALREGRPQVFFAEDEPFGGFQRDASAVAAAVEGIRSPDRTIRRVSAEILGQLGAPEATDALLAALKDRDPPVRIAVLRGLVRANASAAMLEIGGRLNDPEPEVRKEAVVALNRLAADPESTAQAVRRLLDDPEPEVRAAVSVALASTDPESLRLIREMGRADDADIRVAILEALGESATPGGLETVLELLIDPLPSVRRKAAKAAASYSPAAAVDPLIRALGDTDLSVRTAAIESLGAFGAHTAASVAVALDYPSLEDGALAALEHLHAAPPSDALERYALSAGERATGYYGIWNAARREAHGETVQVLVDALRDRGLVYAARAVRALGLLGDREATRVALENLASSDPGQRANALETLESSSHREIVAPLIPLWEPDAVPGSIDGAWLLRALDDADPWIRACAVLAAAEAGDPDSRERAASLAATDPDPEVREVAGRMLSSSMDTLATLSIIERILLLRRVPLLSGLASDDLKQLASIAGERAYSDREVISEEGEPGDELYVIVSGAVAVVVGLDGASQTDLALRGPGDYVGEMAVITGGQRSASLVARGDVRILFIEGRHFASLLRERPDVSLSLMKTLVERIQESNRFLPRDLAAKLETARARRAMVGERRTVTMLFCDVAGSTSMAEDLDPEEWAEIMNRAFEALIAPVYLYEGTLARMMGDAILAFFGAPIAHEDDAERAVRAGLAMIEAITDLRDELARARGLDFNIRVGINTGLVVVGEVGSDLKVEYTALGDAVNVAARMEQAAAAGTVQISEATHRLVAPMFDSDDLGLVGVKGKREPVRAYRVLSPRERPGKTRGIEGLSSPLVGREGEIETLRRCVTALGGGTGQIVALIGEAGLGKSRLIAELRSEWRDRSGEEGLSQWVEARAVSYESARPYAQLRQYIRHFCRVTDHDPPQEARRKIAAAAERIGSVAADRVRRVYEIVLGVEDDAATIEGEELKREVFEVVSETIRAWARQRPSVLVAEDLHWSDEASLDLLAHLCALSADVPILVLCALRPVVGRVGEVAEKVRASFPDRFTEMTLAPLSPDESAALVGDLLQIEDLNPDLRGLILEKSSGNPFFIEEILRSLIDNGAVVRDNGTWRVARGVSEIAVPDHLQGLLAARIDALDAATRRELQLAAVAGSTFHYRVLRTISEDPKDLGDHLDKLERAGLIVEVAEVPELEFRFRHPLIAEAAYRSLLQKDRVEYHRKVGEAMEDLFRGREEDAAATLAYHFVGAGDPRALHYCTLAADQAARLYAQAEAIAHYTAALAIAKTDPSKADLAHLYNGLATACQLAGKFEQALGVYEEFAATATSLGDRSMELSALGSLATIRSTPNPMYDPLKARDLLERALALARDIGDTRAQARTHWNLMLLMQFGNVGNAEEALAHGEHSLAIARDLQLTEQLAYTLNDISATYFEAGGLDDGITALDEARTLWTRLNNKVMLADATGRAADLNAYAARFEAAKRLADEAYEIAVRINNPWGQGFAQTTRADALWHLGSLGRALAEKERSIGLSAEGGFIIGETGVRSQLAGWFAQLGIADRALELANQAVAVTRETFEPGLPWVLADLSRVRSKRGELEDARRALAESEATLGPSGFLNLHARAVIGIARAEIALLEGEASAATAGLERHISWLHSNSFNAFAMEARILRARALIDLDQPHEARRLLEETRAQALESGSRWILWQALALLAEVEGARAPERAAAHRKEARQMVEELRETLPEEYRESFSSTPDVARLSE